jgi:lysophospholipase L1-like esterase
VKAALAVEGALDHLYIFRAARSLYTRTALPEGAPRTLVPRVDPAAYAANLEALVARCRSRGVQPVFVALPRRVREGDPPVESPYPGLLARTAAARGVPLLAVPPLSLGTASGPNDALFIDSLHFSAAGNDAMAAGLAAQLAALGLVPAGP